ncbi:MAG: KH domain-containing protein [Lentisphaeria bacterium]|nr:KH domain-containing protein [Lentisphaeria bacterium]
MAENPKFDEYKSQIIRMLDTMFDCLGLTGEFKVEENGSRIGVLISSTDAGRVIGRKGQTLESLQLLVNRMLFKTDENAPLVTLDIDGYADGDRERRSARREERGERGESGSYERRPRRSDSGAGHASSAQLELQAQDAAKEVKRWGEPVKLPEMNAHDRRIIHITLKDDPEVVTESIGEGAMKKVVISLKKAE